MGNHRASDVARLCVGDAGILDTFAPALHWAIGATRLSPHDGSTLRGMSEKRVVAFVWGSRASSASRAQGGGYFPRAAGNGTTNSGWDGQPERVADPRLAGDLAVLGR